MFERLLLGFFYKKTMWFVRIGILVGAIGCVIYGSYVPAHYENWEWADLCNMPGYWIWAVGFLRIGVPYLIFARIIRFLVPNIDEQYEECRANSRIPSIFDLLPLLYFCGPHIWAFFHPVKEDYARQYYYGRTAPYHETALEICHRIKVENFRKYSERHDLGFSYSEADREILRQESAGYRRTEEYSKEVGKKRLARGDYYGWNGWRDKAGAKHKIRPYEDLGDKYYRLMADGTMKKVQQDTNYMNYLYGKPDAGEQAYWSQMPEDVFKEMSDEEFARYCTRARYLNENI